MIKVEHVIDYLHEIAPNEFQEPYDNSGLLVGHDQNEVTGIVVSLDTTEAVIQEAIELGANLVISHHPIIFGGLKRLVGANYVQRTVEMAIKNDINLFAIHTNLDNVFYGGVNTNIANLLGLTNQSILLPKQALEYKGQAVGAGVIGELPNPMHIASFFELLKDKLSLKTFKHTAMCKSTIHNVAICGGSGKFLLETAISSKADIFISSDFKYHEFFDADNQIIIADIGHFESEQFTIKMLHRILTNKFNNFASHCTKVDTNPVNYF